MLPWTYAYNRRAPRANSRASRALRRAPQATCGGDVENAVAEDVRVEYERREHLAGGNAENIAAEDAHVEYKKHREQRVERCEQLAVCQCTSEYSSRSKDKQCQVLIASVCDSDVLGSKADVLVSSGTAPPRPLLRLQVLWPAASAESAVRDSWHEGILSSTRQVAEVLLGPTKSQKQRQTWRQWTNQAHIRR